jgi:DNA polymerase I-like protein with 3'-5' exonuclease and polymerase domains
MLRGKFELFVGEDDHSRVYPNPWWTNTGRNNPSNSNFPFTLPKCVRPLVKPKQGQALAYVDLKSAEVGIAAGLSKDGAMMEMYQESIRPGGEDCYVGFAKLAGAIPTDGNEKTHPKERSLYKTALLATNYGQGVASLARRNNIPLSVAKSVLAAHKFIFSEYWSYINTEIFVAQSFHGKMSTLWGWDRDVAEDTYHNPLKNFPVQAGGAEILRQASVYMVEAGLKIGALVHDAVVLLGTPDNIEDSIARCKECFERASWEYMTFKLGCDSKIILYPHRWGDNGEEDPEDFELWIKIQRLLDEIEAPPKSLFESA